jgi:hypothetical protein
MVQAPVMPKEGIFGTLDLLVLTSLDQLLLKLQTKEATLMRRSAVLSLPFQLVFLIKVI